MTDTKGTDLSPYPVYKQSDIPGIEGIPEHWEAVQLGRIGEFSKGSGGTKEDEVPFGIPCVRYGDIYTTHKRFITQTRSFISPEKAAEYMRIQKGDVLFPTSGETIEEIGKSAVNLMDSPVYCGGDLIIFRSTTPVEPRFAGYALDCPHSQDQKSRMGRGVSIMHIYSNQLKYLWLALPTLDEQVAIVRFLDDADQRIRAYVSAKERLIALLEEMKQAVIHQAVTRGLDPNVKLKPSGVEWLGDVPGHWEVRRLRHLGEAIIGLTYQPQDVRDTGLLVLRASNISGGKITFEDKVMVEKDIPNRLITQQGDILVCSRSGSRALIGKNAKIDSMAEGMTFGAFMTIFRGSNNDYLHQVFNSRIFEYQSGAFSTSTINQLTLGMINSIHVPFPPFKEREEITLAIEGSTTTIQTAIDQARRQIDLMTEYRTRLIADVVTGKIDVREAKP